MTPSEFASAVEDMAAKNDIGVKHLEFVSCECGVLGSHKYTGVHVGSGVSPTKFVFGLPESKTFKE